MPDTFRVGASLLSTTMRVVHDEACPEIGPICNVRDEPPQLHDQRLYLVLPRLLASYQATAAFGVDAEVPFKVLRTTIQYTRLDGTPFDPDYPNIHHRNETLGGLMDPRLYGRAAGAFAGFGLEGRVGLTFPFGAIEPDPFVLGEEGVEHQHIQFGSGTVQPLLEARVSRAFGAVRSTLSVQAELSLYENLYGYRPGNRYAVMLAGELPVGPVRVGASADLLQEDQETWSGVAHDEGNLGRTDVLGGATVRFSVGGWDWSAALKVPVWTRTVGGQLEYPLLLELSGSRAIAR